MSQYANQGRVSRLSEKDWYDQRKGRNIVLYSFQIEGSNRWFRTGTNEPSFNQGDFIEFVNDAKGNVDLGTVRVGNGGGPAQSATQQAPAPTPAPRSSGGGGRSGGGGQTRDGYWAEKERRDIEKDERYQQQDIPRMTYSATLQPAVDLVVAALANDAVSFGKTTKGNRLDFLQGLVEEVHNRLFVQVMTLPERKDQILEDYAHFVQDAAEAAYQEPAAEGGYDYDE